MKASSVVLENLKFILFTLLLSGFAVVVFVNPLLNPITLTFTALYGDALLKRAEYQDSNDTNQTLSPTWSQPSQNFMFYQCGLGDCNQSNLKEIFSEVCMLFCNPCNSFDCQYSIFRKENTSMRYNTYADTDCNTTPLFDWIFPCGICDDILQRSDPPGPAVNILCWGNTASPTEGTSLPTATPTEGTSNTELPTTAPAGAIVSEAPTNNSPPRTGVPTSMTNPPTTSSPSKAIDMLTISYGIIGGLGLLVLILVGLFIWLYIRYKKSLRERGDYGESFQNLLT